MKITTLLVAAACGALMAPMAHAQAKSATVNLYKAKCASCHGPDGSANVPAGKALGAHDFHSQEVLSQTDAQLLATITDGKNKMPGFSKDLKPAELQAMVAYVRELGNKK